MRRFPVVGRFALVGLALALTAGAGLYLRIEKRVTLVVDGGRRSVLTFGDTVADVLDRHGVSLIGDMTVSPPLGADVVDGMTVAVRPVDDGLRGEGRAPYPSAGPTLMRVREIERVVLPFPTEVTTSDGLFLGESEVTTPGRPGIVRLVHSVRSTAEGIVAVRLVSREVVRAPVPRVVVEGTAEPMAREGVATWYERDGLVAAHRFLPIGTSVVVTNAANGRRVTVIIDDRGPFGAGRIIDLSDDAFARLAPLSRGTLWVRIAW